jgi:hypothetical protein
MEPDLGIALDAVTDPTRFAGCGAHNRHVAGIDRKNLLDNATLLVGLGRASVALDHVNTFDKYLVPSRIDGDDNALGAPVFTRKHPDAVALFDLHL